MLSCMGKRTEYMRKYQRRRRAADPQKAKKASREAYKQLKARERSNPELKKHRKIKNKEWRQAHRRELAKKSAEYYSKLRSTPEGLQKSREQSRRGRDRYNQNPRNRIKKLARWRASKALQRGHIKRQPCEECGEHAEMHHHDYRKPLEVQWLCRKHHAMAHRLTF